MTEPHMQPCDDEIELIDILRVLYKWKMLIASGVFIIGLAAFFVCLNMDTVYRVSMTVQPGMMQSTPEGKRVMIDSIDTIAARIKAGIYDETIIDRAVKRPESEKPQELAITVETPKQSDVLVVSYDTHEPKEGVAILNELFACLTRSEHELVTYIVADLNRKISLDTLDLQKRKEIELSYGANIQNIDKRITELQADIEVNNLNSVHLSDERKKLLDTDTAGEKALAVLLYSNTIQQNIQFVNAVKNDLNEQKMLREQLLQKVITEKNEQKKITEQILMNTGLRDQIAPMTMIRVPTVGKHPVKPKPRLIVVLSVAAGFFVMIFASFFVEYIRNNPVSLTDEPDERQES